MLVQGAAPEDLAEVIAAAGQLLLRIGTADAETLAGLGDEIGRIETGIVEAGRRVGERLQERQRIAEAAGQLDAPEGALDPERNRCAAKEAVAPGTPRPGAADRQRCWRPGGRRWQRCATPCGDRRGAGAAARTPPHRQAAGQIEAPEGALDPEREEVRLAKEGVTQALGQAPLTDNVLEAGRQALETLRDTVRRVGEAAGRRRQESQRIAEAAGNVEPPEGAEEPEREEIRLAKEAVTLALAPLPLTEDVLEAGRNALSTLQQAAQRIATDAQQRKEAHDQIAEAAGLIQLPPCLEDQRQALEEAQQKVTAALEPPITAQRNQDAAQALDELRQLITTVEQELDSLGGLANVADTCIALGVAPEAYAQLEGALGGRKAAGELLKAFPPQELTTLCTGLGGGLTGAARLGQILPGFGTAATLKTTMADLGGAGKLAGLVVTGGLSGAAAKQLCDDLGAKAVGALMGDADDPTDAIAIQGQLGQNAKALRDLVADGGFDGKPAALAALFTKGCGGDAARFAQLCTDFDDDDDRAALKGLVDEGGLGDAPDVLADLFATGCGGSSDQLRTLSESFGDAGKRAGLKRALTQGGLAGQTGVPSEGDIDTGSLSALLKDGAGPAPGSFAGDDVKRRADGLAALFENMDATACGNMKTMLTKGGLGTEPEVMAHLVGIGCEGDAGALTALAAELNTDPAKLKALDDLVKEGGFGTVDAGSAPTGTDAKCLARLFDPGSNGDPQELTKLLTALGANDLANMKGIMTTGELGQHPEVVGGMYQHGCLTDPDGPSGGAKDPQFLKDMMGEFAAPNGPAEFQDLLVNGGFTGGGNEHRLGSVLRYACSGKNPPAARDGRVLKQFHTAFNGHMADLVTTMNAFDAAPDEILEQSTPTEPNQPGKAFRNVVNAPGHGNGAPDATRLHNKFFTTLNNKATANAGSVATPARLDLDALLQNAASFEMQPFPAGNVAMNLGGRAIDLRIDHVMYRHTRECNAFHLNGSSKSTLYPRGTDSARVQTLVTGTWGNIPNPNRGNRPGGPPMVPKANPPNDTDDLDGNYTPYPSTPIPPGLSDNNGGQAKIGFNPVPTPPPSTDVYIAQFFPVDDGTGTGGTPGNGGLLTVHNSDMREMRDALQ